MICFFVYNPSRKEYVGENGQFVTSYHDAKTWPTYKYLKIYLGDIVRYAAMDKMEWYADAYVCRIQDVDKAVYKPALELLWHEYFLLKENPQYDLPLFKEHRLEIAELLEAASPPDVGTVKVPDIWG